MHEFKIKEGAYSPMQLELILTCQYYDTVPYMFLGWYWAFSTGDWNLNLMSISPVAMSHSNTFQSVEELSSLVPLRFQLRE